MGIQYRKLTSEDLDTFIQMRIMTIDDYDKVYALWMSCKNMGFNNLDDSREGIDKYLKRNPSTCFVAAAEDSVVGVFCPAMMEGGDLSITWLCQRSIGVRELHQVLWSMLCQL